MGAEQRAEHRSIRRHGQADMDGEGSQSDVYDGIAEPARTTADGTATGDDAATRTDARTTWTTWYGTGATTYARTADEWTTTYATWNGSGSDDASGTGTTGAGRITPTDGGHDARSRTRRDTAGRDDVNGG